MMLSLRMQGIREASLGLFLEDFQALGDPHGLFFCLIFRRMFQITQATSEVFFACLFHLRQVMLDMHINVSQ